MFTQPASRRGVRIGEEMRSCDGRSAPWIVEAVIHPYHFPIHRFPIRGPMTKLPQVGLLARPSNVEQHTPPDDRYEEKPGASPSPGPEGRFGVHTYCIRKIHLALSTGHADLVEGFPKEVLVGRGSVHRDFQWFPPFSRPLIFYSRGAIGTEGCRRSHVKENNSICRGRRTHPSPLCPSITVSELYHARSHPHTHTRQVRTLVPHEFSHLTPPCDKLNQGVKPRRQVDTPASQARPKADATLPTLLPLRLTIPPEHPPATPASMSSYQLPQHKVEALRTAFQEVQRG